MTNNNLSGTTGVAYWLTNQFFWVHSCKIGFIGEFCNYVNFHLGLDLGFSYISQGKGLRGSSSSLIFE